MIKFIKSVTYAVEGLSLVLREHPNFWIHLILAFIALVTAKVLSFTSLEFAVLAVTIMMVIMAEIANTAVEELSDLVTVRWSKHAKVAKDISAGMVLVVSVGAVVVGLLLFVPKLY